MKRKTKTSTHLSNLPVFILLTFSMLYFTACKDDEKTPAHPLVGTWYMSAFDQTGCTEPAENMSFTLSCTPTGCFELKIFSDQTYQIKSIFQDEPTETISGTYKIQGTNLEICEDNLYCSNGDFIILPGNNGFTLTETDGASGCVAVSTFTRK